MFCTPFFFFTSHGWMTQQVVLKVIAQSYLISYSFNHLGIRHIFVTLVCHYWIIVSLLLACFYFFSSSFSLTCVRVRFIILMAGRFLWSVVSFLIGQQYKWSSSVLLPECDILVSIDTIVFCLSMLPLFHLIFNIAQTVLPFWFYVLVAWSGSLRRSVTLLI